VVDDLEVDDSLEMGAPEMAWSQVWQVPALLLGLGLLAVGVYLALPKIIPPDYDKDLAQIDAQIQQNQLSDAEENLDLLKSSVEFERNAGKERIGRMWQLYGDLRFNQIDQQVWQGITTPTGLENLKQITTYYAAADDHGWEMPSAAIRRYAEALAALGKDTEALEVIDRLPMESAVQRVRVVRSLIERRLLTDEDPATEVMHQLLTRYDEEAANIADPKAQRVAQIWALSLRADRLIRARDGAGVIQLLAQGTMMRLRNRGATGRELAPLDVALGEAYALVNNFIDAGFRLDEASQSIEDGDEIRARILVARANIILAQDRSDNIEAAHNLFAQAFESDRRGAWSIPALIGMGRTEAERQDRFPEALDAFTQATDRLVAQQAPHWDPNVESLKDHLQTYIQREMASDRYISALDLLDVYQKLDGNDADAELLHLFAQVHEQIAIMERKQADALNPNAQTPGTDPNSQARRIHNQDAARHFEQAANFYRREASLLAGSQGDHGDVLWKAAECYNNAQRWEQAIAVYRDYLLTEGEPARLEEARFRLGQAYLADGEFEAAAGYFRELIDASQTSEWSKRAYVPLAQAYSALGRWDEAEVWLRAVTEDHPAINPDSDYFRDATIALGTLYYRRGAENGEYYARAIEVLGNEGGAVERYAHERYTNPSSQDFNKNLAQLAPRLRYMLADCLRLSAEDLGARAFDASDDNDRRTMQAERVRRLMEAQIYYSQVVQELDGHAEQAMQSIDRDYHRNAYFYKADCAYFRGDLPSAIQFYQDAAHRWQDHPSALVAWVQIMNASAEMGDFERARAANVQAAELLERYPQEVFDRPDSLMSAQRWDDWLRWTTGRSLYGETAEVPTGN